MFVVTFPSDFSSSVLICVNSSVLQRHLPAVLLRAVRGRNAPINQLVAVVIFMRRSLLCLFRTRSKAAHTHLCPHTLNREQTSGELVCVPHR